jgi:hypothetical protein
MVNAGTAERGSALIDDLGRLFEYTLKCLALAAFLELVLYRLVSRLGMHFSKLATEHDSVRLLFKGLSSIGFTLLNFVALLGFLALSIVLTRKMQGEFKGPFDGWVIPAVGLLMLLTVGFLVVPPAMLGSVAYNLVTVAVLTILAVEYFRTHREWLSRLTVGTFLLGIFGWLYYQTLSTAYGLLGAAAVPPMVHEANRGGEALMVLASILVLASYGGLSLKTKNRRQRRRFLLLAAGWAFAFLTLFFLDYLLGLHDPKLADGVRKASQGIGWIFQMGMGYTFFLPFALYVTGLVCWAYTVVKLIAMGRPAGYGLALMFMAGYALQLSHLTLMVVLGLMLLNLDRRRQSTVSQAEEPALSAVPGSMVGEHS